MKVKIRVVMDFKDDVHTFYKGEERFVSEAKAGYYVGVGWAAYQGEQPAEPDLSPKILEVQAGVVDHTTQTQE